MFRWASVPRLPSHLGEFQHHGKSRADGRSRFLRLKASCGAHTVPRKAVAPPHFLPGKVLKTEHSFTSPFQIISSPSHSSVPRGVGQGRRCGNPGAHQNLVRAPLGGHPACCGSDRASALSLTHFLPIHPSLLRPARRLLACRVPQLLLPRASG